MGEHILSRLQAGMDGFSKGQKRLAAYILADPRQAALKTAEELSRCAGVSASTAVRFAAALGYAGYPEMQRDLQRVALSGTAPASPAGGLTQTMEADIRQIRQVMAGLDRGAFCRSAEAAGKARRVYVLGFPLAALLAQGLWRLRPDVIAVPRGEEERLGWAGPGDMVILLDFPPYATDSALGAETAWRQGAKVVAITDRPDAPAAKRAGMVLTVPAKAGEMAAPASLIRAWLTAVAEGKGSEYG